MDRMLILTQDEEIGKLPRRVYPFEGDLDWQTVKDPTIALMTLEEAQKFNEIGLMIAMAVEATSPNSLQKAISLAYEMSASGRVNVLSSGPYAVYGKERHSDSPKGKFSNRPPLFVWPRKGTARYMVGIDPRMLPVANVEWEWGSNSTLNFTILTSTMDMSGITISPEVRTVKSHDPQGPDNPSDPPEGNQILKAPLRDEMLVKALTEAVEGLLGKEQDGLIKWEENGNYYEKNYNVNHLMVCLFYYVHANKLNSKENFYYRQRTQFQQYIENALKETINVCLDRYFRYCISKLQWRKHGFDEYIIAEYKPEVNWERGMFNPFYWYAIYQRAAEYFEKVLSPRAKT